MSPTDYLDPDRFPLTTRHELGVSGQLFLDAATWEAIVQFEAAGGVLDDADRTLKAELAEKVPHHGRLLAELNSQRSGQALATPTCHVPLKKRGRKRQRTA